jgi:hypothetical protein
MATTKAPPSEKEVTELEEKALEHLAEEGLPKAEQVPDGRVVGPPETPPLPITRLGVVVAFPVLAAAVMAGGVFVELSARFWGAIAGILGILVAVWAHRIRRPIYTYLAIAVGVFGIGLFLIMTSGFGNIFDVRALVRTAVRSGDVQRPPVVFDPGWRAIMGWLMGGIGFMAGWIALELRRPALSLLIPMPVVAFTAISVADAEQLPSGLIALVLFAIGLGLLSGTEMGEAEERPSLAYELRRGVRALPLLGGIVGAIYLLAQTQFLFPPPIIDPTQEAKKPQTVPLSEVRDRVLFRVESSITGPWRIGHLDVYDGADWRLPPFAASELEDVPRSGVVDSELVPGVKAKFILADLGGAVLPGLPNTVGIVAEGPRLAFDDRLGNIRLAQGSVDPGLQYDVVAARVPTIEELQEVDQPVPSEIRPFLEIPEPPPAVRSLLDRAPQDTLWDKMNFMREELLKTVVSSGAGTPTSVTPERVDDMLVGSKEGTPFEIVAAQAMLARWAGVPSRIAYGFDGGDKVGDSLEVRPKHGSSFLEVYFSTYKWVPVIGTPLQAKSSLTNDPQQFNPTVLASNDLAVRIHIPVALDRGTLLFAQVRRILLIVIPIILVALAIYYTWPALSKAVLKARRRSWAHDQGAAARIMVAYGEWRDTCTDFGYRWDADTPLMFLDRIVDDEEHTELAWLVTRTLWGDLRDEIGEQDAAAAEELAKSLKRRLGQAHPFTLRMIAAVSRLSLKYSYVPLQLERPAKRRAKDVSLQPA